MDPTDHEITEARATLDAFRRDWRDDTGPDLSFARVSNYAVELANALDVMLAHVDELHATAARDSAARMASMTPERRGDLIRRLRETADKLETRER